MKIGIYPGSFNPWHEGHSDILDKALDIFDKVIIARGRNPEKETFKNDIIDGFPVSQYEDKLFHNEIELVSFKGLLVDFVSERKGDAVIRGLRNGHDLQYEMNQQYYNEDLGLEAQTIYFICDRSLSHISSSAIRALAKIKGK